MLVRPGDLPDRSVVAALGSGWGLGVVSVEYQPIGFGSHHWRVLDDQNVSWFATVDDLRVNLRGGNDSVADVRTRLHAALATARAVADAGASFVVAPLRRTDTDVLGRIGDSYAIALYPYVEGRRFGFGHVFGPHDRQRVIATLAALHATAETTRRTARQETFDLPQRQLLLDALNERDTRWDTGPYGEPARELVKTHMPMIGRLLARHDEGAADARDRPDRMVLTHGEPHPGNLIETGEGWKLVDWDTALLAPPERDLWSLHPTADPAESSYTDLTGRLLERSMLTFYREAWALNDIAAYVSQFREPHTDDANQREAWTALTETVEEVTP